MDDQVKILLFGILAEKTAASEIFFPIEKDTDTLLANLKNKYPDLNDLKFSIAINQKIISGNTPIDLHDEIALLPPFSGG